MKKEIKILAKTPKSRIEWHVGDWAPLKIYGTNSRLPKFAAYPHNIYEWTEAPQSVRDRAQRIMDKNGQTQNPEIVCLDVTEHTVVCVSTPAIAEQIRELLPGAKSAEAARIEAEKKAEEERKAELEHLKAVVRAACPEGFEPCETGRWFDGLLECRASDGTTVDQWDSIDCHDCGIAYVPHDVLEAKRARNAELAAAKKIAEEKRIAEEKAAEEHEAECIAKAKQSGERVAIRSYSVPCRDQHEECDIDIATVWAMPDGTTTTTYQHTW